MATKVVNVVRCDQCGAIPTKRKNKPLRPWRRKAYVKYFCVCGRRWRVWRSASAK